MTTTTTSLFAGEPADARQFLVYVGTYTGPKSNGIYVCRFDATTGKLTAPELAVTVVHPSFIALHPNHRFLYAVGEMDHFEGKNAGAVSAFSIAPDTGRLTLLNQVSAGGTGPCHLTVDKTGQCVLVGNYTGGSVAALPIQADGRLAEATTVIQHTGSSINPTRQKVPHVHSVNVDPENHYVFAADLGIDKILTYRLDPLKSTLAPSDPPFTAVKPGSGPRHFAFHPTGRFAYVINELANTVTVFRYDPANGALAEIQTVPTIPADYTNTTYTADVVVHPNGKFLYGSNRGHDSIAVFAINQDKGTLTLVEIQSTGGRWPRGFTIDPTGGWLLAATEHSDTIVIFRIDQSTGKLTATGDVASIPAPTCIRFLAVQNGGTQ